MAEESMTQALPVGSALDEPWNVGEHELAIVYLDDTQIRLDRCERIVGDLRPRGRNPCDQGALAGVGKPDDGCVRHRLELEREVGLGAVLALLGEVGSDMPWADQRGVSPSGPPTGEKGHPLPRTGEIGQDSPHSIAYDRARRHAEYEVVATFPVLKI